MALPEFRTFKITDEEFCGECYWQGKISDLLILDRKYACPKCKKSSLYPVMRCDHCEWVDLECYCNFTETGNRHCPECNAIADYHRLPSLDN
jgi:hypothetical protein